LSTTFNGTAGNYDLTIYAQDENDGQSTIMVKVNGQVVGNIKLDNDTDGGGSNNGAFSAFTIQDIDLKAGDDVAIWVKSDKGEYVRIDKIELCQDGEVCPEGYAVLDFEGFASGTVIDNQFDGVTITAQRDVNNTAANDAMIFDSNNPTGGDHDLGYNGRGNILIVSEDNDSNDADDAVGGKMTFDFDNPSDLHDIVLLDIEENGGTIMLTFEDGSTQTIDIPAAGNNSAQTIDLTATGVTQMMITLTGSGAVDDLCWAPGEAPAPASLGGTYFMDANNNDIQDGGDMAVAGATVALLLNGTVIDTTTTDANGDYLFENLAAGDGYSIRFIDTGEGKTFVDGNVGGDDTIDSDVVSVGTGGNGNTGTISLAAGEDKRNVDGGIEDPGTAQLSGRLTLDDDKDDTEFNTVGADAFDEGLVGKTVELLDENGAVVATTTTGNDGEYSFTGLAAGTYSVRFPDVMDFVFADKGVGVEHADSDANPNNGTTDPITLNIGDNVPNIDASVQDPGTASLAGRVFMDSDDDSQDNGEMGVSGVTVTLLNADGTPTGLTAETGADGSYIFENLDAGGYIVDFPTEVDGKVLVDSNVGPDATDSDADQGTGETGVINLAIGEASVNNDAGVEDQASSAIEGRVFMDSDDDNQDNGEMGVSGVTVTLLNADGSPTGRTTTTAADGSYAFAGLVAGGYIVSFPTEVDGKVLVDSNVGPDATDSDALANGQTGVITVGVNETSSNNDAGVEDPGTASIGDTLFLDLDGNGIQEPFESGVDGVQVTLTDANGMVVGTTTTMNGGQYLFDGLDAGDYVVDFDDVPGLEFTTKGAGNDDKVDSDVDANGTSDTITLAIGEDNRDVDAGVTSAGPEVADDEAMTCANEEVTVDVLANDGATAQTITMVGDQNIVEGQTVTIGGIFDGEGNPLPGVEVTLSNGELVFDGEAAFEYLNIGETAVATISYKVADSFGATASADVDITFCGTAESLQEICDSLPATASIQVINENNPIFTSDEAYTAKITTGDARIDGVFAEAYCVANFDSLLADGNGSDIDLAPIFEGALFCAVESEVR